MTIKTKDVERLMKQCQIGVGGKDALNKAHNIMADCYGTLGALARERDQLQAELAKYRDASLLKEVYLINDAYVRIRSERLFAIDDLEYDLFSAGWKAAVDLIVKPGETK